MERSGIRSEERTGLMVAVALHLLLLAVFVIQALRPAPVVEPVERMTVNLAEDVGLEATAPDPVPESRAAAAPVIADNPVPAPPEEIAEPLPVERPVTRVDTPAPRPRPVERPVERPQTRRPDPPRTQARPRPAQQRPSGSRLSDDFLDGAGASATSSETRVPASQIGASAKASIVGAIARQVKPHFQGKTPSGAEADQLVTILAFDLNPDGSLKGTPRVVSQQGITPANEAQKDRHAEVAIRAVQLAAPFDLPAEYYNAWKSIRGARFDRNLSR